MQLVFHVIDRCPSCVEGFDRDLPALQVVWDCSDKALDWLKAYYWEPQKMQIPFQGDGTAEIRRDIRSKLRELAFCLNVKQNSELSSSLIYRKMVIVLFMLYWHMVNTAESNDSITGFESIQYSLI
ncbi:las1-like family protein [Melia azedarach]|uniref:Las1-like family protein n=1 Tax=Melia azedarach TaxID=155640 RepID=A0ACC1WPE2_MELAZ|nr:las1-like family protein [Melia azedarach]